MFAGYATTANGLTSCCFMLARHPEVQEKLHDLIMSKIDEYVRTAKHWTALDNLMITLIFFPPSEYRVIFVTTWYRVFHM